MTTMPPVTLDAFGGVLFNDPVELDPERRAKLLHLAQNDGQPWTDDQDGSGWTDHMAEFMYGRELDRIEARSRTGECPANECVRTDHHEIHQNARRERWRTVAPLDYLLPSGRAHDDPDAARTLAQYVTAQCAHAVAEARTEGIAMGKEAAARDLARLLEEAEARGRARAIADIRWLGRAQESATGRLIAENIAELLEGPAWLARHGLPGHRIETWRRRLAGHRHEEQEETSG